MAYDRVIADRIRTALVDHPAVREVKMFGGLAFMLNDKMALYADGHGDLMVRCDPARVDDLLGDEAAEWAEMRGRRMNKGWITVRADGIGSEGSLAYWLDLALEYNDQVTR